MFSQGVVDGTQIVGDAVIFITQLQLKCVIVFAFILFLQGVVDGTLTVGDAVLFITQLHSSNVS